MHDARQSLLGHRLNRVDRQAKQLAVVRVRLQKLALKHRNMRLNNYSINYFLLLLQLNTIIPKISRAYNGEIVH